MVAEGDYWCRECGQPPRSKTIKHEDGRQDVVIQVNKLNIDDTTKEGQEAKRVIEEKIIPELANRIVIVTVIEKSTGEFTSCKIKLPQVRQWAEAVVKSKGGELKDFFIVEHEGEQVRVSTL